MSCSLLGSMILGEIFCRSQLVYAKSIRKATLCAQVLTTRLHKKHGFVRLHCASLRIITYVYIWCAGELPCTQIDETPALSLYLSSLSQICDIMA